MLDRSGSMEGWKIVAARRAMARMIDTLGEQDRFTVLAFDNVVETPARARAPPLCPPPIGIGFAPWNTWPKSTPGAVPRWPSRSGRRPIA